MRFASGPSLRAVCSGWSPSNYAWPALYFVDAQGRIRHHHFGEGDYEMSEMILQQLLTEAGSGGQRFASQDAAVNTIRQWTSLSGIDLKDDRLSLISPSAAAKRPP